MGPPLCSKLCRRSTRRTFVRRAHWKRRARRRRCATPQCFSRRRCITCALRTGAGDCSCTDFLIFLICGMLIIRRRRNPCAILQRRDNRCPAKVQKPGSVYLVDDGDHFWCALLRCPLRLPRDDSAWNAARGGVVLERDHARRSAVCSIGRMSYRPRRSAAHPHIFVLGVEVEQQPSV